MGFAFLCTLTDKKSQQPKDIPQGFFWVCLKEKLAFWSEAFVLIKWKYFFLFFYTDQAQLICKKKYLKTFQTVVLNIQNQSLNFNCFPILNTKEEQIFTIFHTQMTELFVLFFRFKPGGLSGDYHVLLQHVLQHLQNWHQCHRLEEQTAQRCCSGQQVFLHRVLWCPLLDSYIFSESSLTVGGGDTW